jgi:hypothetical protein
VRSAARAELIAVLGEARTWLARPDADYAWSSWLGAEQALGEIDDIVAGLHAGGAPSYALAFVFLPTGPMQEVALSSGWGDEFVDLANRMDAAVEALERRAAFACAACGAPAGSLTLEGGRDSAHVLRESFTSMLTRAVGRDEFEPLRAALSGDDARALHALDVELAPFYCPDCDATYCGEHWVRWDVFDDDDPGWHDSARGRCPHGHERMLED